MTTWKDIVRGVIILAIISLLCYIGYAIFIAVIEFVMNVWLWAIMLLL